MDTGGRRRAQKGTGTLGVPEVVSELGVSAKTVRRMIQAGRLTAAQPSGPGGEYRIRRTSVEKLWDELKREEKA